MLQEHLLINLICLTRAESIPPAPIETPGTCAAGWLRGRHHCFHLRTVTADSWSMASAECVMMGATLAVIRNPRDNILIETELIRQREVNGTMAQPIWLGFRVTGGIARMRYCSNEVSPIRVTALVQFILNILKYFIILYCICSVLVDGIETPDGESVSYTNWAQGQPNLQPGVMSGVMMTFDGTWSVRASATPIGYACQQDKSMQADHLSFTYLNLNINSYTAKYFRL